jgi:hypothetical protein
MNNTGDNWSVVVNKKSKKNKKPNKYLRAWEAEIQEKDYTLTQNEEEIIKKEKLENPDLNISCNCCSSSLISDIIKRSFFSCGCCFCCNGCDLDFVPDIGISFGIFHEYNKDYYYKNDDKFRNNY